MPIEKPSNKQEREVMNNPEQHEADPMIGLERATAEFGSNSGKLDGLLKSEGGTDSLPPEGQEKFSALKENLLSKFETLKGVLAKAAPWAAAGALGAAGVVGLEELRQTFEISKELIGIGLADIIATIGVVGYMKSH